MTDLDTQVGRPQFSTDQYDRLHYRCSECGRSETFQGLAVATRNPIREDADCTMCEMQLVHPERYWSRELVADRIDVHAWPTANNSKSDGERQ